jgi:hypothetical protein
VRTSAKLVDVFVNNAAWRDADHANLRRSDVGAGTAEHREAFESIAQMLSHPFAETLEPLERSVRDDGKLLLFGNSGSAADEHRRRTRDQLQDLSVADRGDRAHH